jgi:signal peptidase II
MRKLSNFAYFSITFLFLSFSNLYFANLITRKLAQGWHSSGPLFNVVYAENTGAAFSLLQNSTKLLTFFAIIALFAIFYYVIKNMETSSKKVVLFLSFLASGILGNLSERVILGHVRDFFDLTFINFPIFNISDVFINIGVLGIIILILLTKKPIKLL